MYHIFLDQLIVHIFDREQSFCNENSMCSLACWRTTHWNMSILPLTILWSSEKQMGKSREMLSGTFFLLVRHSKTLSSSPLGLLFLYFQTLCTYLWHIQMTWHTDSVPGINLSFLRFSFILYTVHFFLFTQYLAL